MSTLIQIRGVTPTTKKLAEDVFHKLGLSTSAAIKLFLNQVAITKAIPFQPTTLTENGFTPEQEEQILHIAQSDEEEGPYSSAEDLIRSLKE